jgi:pSer/pThr/pTyr-binding forkhead associated (FHA) protein
MSLKTFKLTLTSPSEKFFFNSNKDSLIIGRSLKCDFKVPREDLSREHCLLENINNEMFITDLDSKNGVKVNHIRIKPHTPVSITSESHVVLANNYLLKMNLLTLKTEADFIIKDTASPELENIPYEIQAPARKKPQKNAKIMLRDKVAFRVKAYQAHLKMAFYLLIILGLIIYQALGR